MPGMNMVFAPSSLCFNAISYLIETGANYKRIFSSLVELFLRISDVLERCKIYIRLAPEAVDFSLRKIINEELVCFVEICALSIKVMRGNKMLIALKVFAFDSDEGVCSQLERLASLVERESQMRATLGFESQKISERVIVEARDGTKKVSASVDELLTFEKKKDANSMAKRLLSTIDSNLDTPSEAFKDIQAIYKRCLSEQVSGSGQWLLSDPLYASWADSPRPRCLILGLSGAQGVGKSFLFAAIVKHLQEMYNEGGDEVTRTSAAYYIFDKDKNDPSLLKALQVLAWQIAKADIVYRKDLSSVQTASVHQIGSMCNILFGRSSKSDLTVYILLDGIEQMDKQHMKQFLQVLDEWQSSPQGWSRFTLRILLTGRTEIMRRVKDQLGDGISVIDIASKNRDDILKFITNRMDKIDVLSGSTDQVNSLREEILNGLAKRTDGDFINIGLLLDEISTKQRPGEIRDIIARSGDNRSDTIARTIATLNDTLSDEDISDLIELLTWVVFASRPLGADELEAVLFLKTGEASLRPLIEKLRGPYSSLFHIAAARVHLASEPIADFLRQSSTPNDPNETPRDAGDVSESEVRIVRRFLKSVCDPALFAKFEFEEFFKRKLKGRTVRIAVDSELAHLKLASACLEVICSCDSPNLNPLLDYAVQFFGKHLALADPALTLPRHKIALGPVLVKVFTDKEVIDRWWSYDLYNLRRHWIYLDDYAEVIMKWLQDSAVTKNISQEHRQWIKSLSSKSHLDADLLEHVGKVVAHKWLHAYSWDTWEFVGFFMVIRGYMAKIKNRTDPSTARALQDPRPDTIPASDILDAAEWAQAQIGLRELGYEETYNLARTLREWQKYQEAIEQFKHASTLTEENWLSQYGLATCYASNGNLKVAIDILEATMKRIRDGDFGNFEVTDKYLLSMNDELARWHKSIGRDEVALAIYQKRLNADLTDYQAAFNLIQLLHQQARYTDLVEFLQSLKNAIDPDSGLDLRTRNVQRHSRNQLFNEALFALAQDGAEFNLVLESYEEALAAARNQMLEARKADDIMDERRAQLNLVEIMMLIATLRQRASYRDPVHEKCAVDHWTHIIEMDGTHDWFLSTKQASVRSEFALFCFEKAIRSPDLAAEYVQHLENIVSEVSLRNAEDVYWLKRSHPSCLLARYHRLQGNHSKAKSILRFYLKLNLDLLSDEDPLNDWEAYFGLAVLFMFAGDEADALAAWSLITPSGVPEAETRLDNTKKNHHELKGPMVSYCNGDCGTDWTFADNFNVCKTCFDVQLDQECLDKLRAGTLEVKVCNPEHDMLHVPAYDAFEHKRIGKGNVKVGEDILEVEEWLRRIRRDWGLEAA